MICQRALAAGMSPEEAEKIVNKAVVNAVRETTPAVVKPWSTTCLRYWTHIWKTSVGSIRESDSIGAALLS